MILLHNSTKNLTLFYSHPHKFTHAQPNKDNTEKRENRVLLSFSFFFTKREGKAACMLS